MKSKKGVSLIVLIVTIIVVIILAAVVILTLSKNNPIESAKEARFKEDVRTFQDELALYISKQYANAGGHWDGNISAKSYNEIVDYIPSFTKKYEGKFIINNNNLEYTNKLDDKEKEYSQNLNVKGRLLPSEYKKIEYIEMSGKEYINTNFYANTKTTTFEIKIRLNSNDGTRGLFGSRNDMTDGSACCFIQNNNFRLDWMQGETGYYVPAKTGTDYIIVMTRGKAKINYENYTYSNNKSVDQTKSFLIGSFSDRDNGPYKCFVGKIFYANLYSNNVLVRSYIPCYSTTTVTNADGVQVPANTKGLYDTVEGKFYTNQGTGEFIAGPDVNE